MSGFPSVSSRLALKSIAWSCISLASVAPFEPPRFFASSPKPAPLPQPLQGSPLDMDPLSSVTAQASFSMCFLLTGGPRLALHAPVLLRSILQQPFLRAKAMLFGSPDQKDQLS